MNNNIAGQILAEAFQNYPLMLYAFNGLSSAERAKRLQRLYAKCAVASNLYGGVITTPDANGALIWLPAKSFPVGLRREIISGMWTLPFQLGIKQTLRLMNHDGESEGWIKQNARPNMGYLWCIGVRQQAQGKGYSRQLIDECIEQMRAQNITECWLKTEDPKNVEIYKKLGFEVANQMKIKSSGITSWAMVRYIP